ncbi:hypothetical protein, partial [Kosakonia sacchari]|uniref:hypothetical protein n=1 Tax=Kosakonia sacchari TaxID=1158459 RepID=UPI00197DCB25
NKTIKQAPGKLTQLSSFFCDARAWVAVFAKVGPVSVGYNRARQAESLPQSTMCYCGSLHSA